MDTKIKEKNKLENYKEWRYFSTVIEKTQITCS